MPNDLRERVLYITTIHGMPPTPIPSAADRTDDPADEPADGRTDDRTDDRERDPAGEPVAATPDAPG
ncbi:hypothetical protein G6019_13630, partial [Dietzia sp. DQ12-76]|nr:hypothetical protein [Dietzia sp. DQ12-76]